MARRMYDGTDSGAAAIGAQAQPGDLVGGYVDGLYRWSSAQWAALRAGVVRVRIAVFHTTDDGVVLDCEPGNCTPAQSVDWVLMRRRAGVDPTVYCNQHDTETGWPAVRAAFQARGVREPHYWVADYDGVAEIPAGAVAKQYADNLMLGHPWDVSVVADHWPGVDPVSQYTPLPVEDDMSTTSNQAGRAGLSWPAGSRHVVQVTYDPRDGDPRLRVVLALSSGPRVASEAWQLSKGSGVFQIPAESIAACRGVILEGAPAPVYDATAV